MADAYRKVDKPQDALPTNEIRVRRGVGIGRYLKRAWELLNSTEGTDDTVVIKGVSNAVQSAVNLAELVKHRVKGLHQINKISNITIVDEFEPLIEGLDQLKHSRVVTMLQITLTKSDNVDKTDIGYQAPIADSEVQEYNERERLDGDRRERRGGNRGRGGERGARGGARGGRRGGRGGRGRGDGQGLRGGRGGERRPEGERRTYDEDRGEGEDRRGPRNTNTRRPRREDDGGAPRDDYRPPRNNYRGDGERRNNYGDDNRERRPPREPREPRPEGERRE